MSFNNQYPNRKDRLGKYYKSKRFDSSCRCHGSCSYCLNNRLYHNKRELQRTEDELRENNLQIGH
jgi:hypothetical protein